LPAATNDIAGRASEGARLRAACRRRTKCFRLCAGKGAAANARQIPRINSDLQYTPRPLTRRQQGQNFGRSRSVTSPRGCFD
jgi:hypothetical protein